MNRAKYETRKSNQFPEYKNVFQSTIWDCTVYIEREKHNGNIVNWPVQEAWEGMVGSGARLDQGRHLLIILSDSWAGPNLFSSHVSKLNRKPVFISTLQQARTLHWWNVELMIWYLRLFITKMLRRQMWCGELDSIAKRAIELFCDVSSNGFQ